MFICFFISSSKKNLPSQAEKIQQTSAARSRNNTSVSQNLQGSNHVNNDEQGDSMFNDEDDDLDMTEIDQAVLKGKAPLSSQETDEKVSKRNMNHNVVEKTGAVSTSQRYMFCCVNTEVFEIPQVFIKICIDQEDINFWHQSI